jgi:hypothetical protein
MHRVTHAELNSSDKLYNVPIGKPVPGWQCFLYDDETDTVIDPLDDTQLSSGVLRSASGICYVRGPGVLQCYLNRDDLTQAAFLTHHLKLPVPLYRVGDVCHYNVYGDLVFEGRRDNQIKIQGQRMEPGEVEVVIQSHEGVSGSVVKLIKPVLDQPEHDFLCAYVNLQSVFYSSAQHSPQPGSLTLLPLELERSLLSLCTASLPKFMVPKVFLNCAVWPRTLSGKISRLDIQPPHTSLLHDLVQRRNAERLGCGDSAARSTNGSSETTSELMSKVRAAVAATLRSSAVIIDSSHDDQPLLDLGMNSMQLTLLVSIIRANIRSTFSIGNLLLLPAISISSIAAMLTTSSLPTASNEPAAPSEVHQPVQYHVIASCAQLSAKRYLGAHLCAGLPQGAVAVYWAQKLWGLHIRAPSAELA